MEFLVIADTKLKISLDEAECQKYNIDVSASDFSASEIRSIMRDILSLAGQKCGFITGREKILVQLYPMPDRSCEIFVTKLGQLSFKEREALCSSRELTSYQQKRGVYKFSCLETLKRAIRAVYRKDVSCDLYRSENGEYYIEIREDFTNGLSEFEILIEYGDRLRYLPLFVVSEYGSKLAQDNGFDVALEL